VVQDFDGIMCWERCGNSQNCLIAQGGPRLRRVLFTIPVPSGTCFCSHHQQGSGPDLIDRLRLLASAGFRPWPIVRCTLPGDRSRWVVGGISWGIVWPASNHKRGQSRRDQAMSWGTMIGTSLSPQLQFMGLLLTPTLFVRFRCS